MARGRSGPGSANGRPPRIPSLTGPGSDSVTGSRSASGSASSSPSYSWVPPEQREDRGWRNAPRTLPAGICRYCARPILVPDRKGVTVKQAVQRRPPPRRPRHRERDRALYERLTRTADRLRRRPPPGLQLYRRATWHPACFEAWRWRADAKWALWQLQREDPRCRSCGVDLDELRRRADAWRSAAWRACRDLRERAFTLDWRVEGALVEAPRRALQARGYSRPGDSWAELDHVVPLWAGGTSDRENLQVLCQPCHRDKTRLEARLRGKALRAWRREHGGGPLDLCENQVH